MSNIFTILRAKHNIVNSSNRIDNDFTTNIYKKRNIRNSIAELERISQKKIRIDDASANFFHDINNKKDTAIHQIFTKSKKNNDDATKIESNCTTNTTTNGKNDNINNNDTEHNIEKSLITRKNGNNNKNEIYKLKQQLKQLKQENDDMKNKHEKVCNRFSTLWEHYKHNLNTLSTLEELPDSVDSNDFPIYVLPYL